MMIATFVYLHSDIFQCMEKKYHNSIKAILKKLYGKNNNRYNEYWRETTTKNYKKENWNSITCKQSAKYMLYKKLPQT